jgi:hypothetical protein
MSFSMEILEALSDKNCWGQREREVDHWCFLLGDMISLSWTSFFGIASIMWSVESKLVMFGIEEGSTTVIAASVLDVLKKLWTEIENFLEGCYLSVVSTLKHIGNCK